MSMKKGCIIILKFFQFGDLKIKNPSKTKALQWPIFFKKIIFFFQ